MTNKNKTIMFALLATFILTMDLHCLYNKSYLGAAFDTVVGVFYLIKTFMSYKNYQEELNSKSNLPDTTFIFDE